MSDHRRLKRGLLVCMTACIGTWSIGCVESACCAELHAAIRQSVDLKRGFREPPAAVRPWAYWWWLKGNVSEASITRDLEAMKAKGFAGMLMFDARGYHEDHVPPPPSRMDFMGPEWRRTLRFAISEADRLGLKMSVNLSSCAGALKGPWPVGDDAPKKLVWTAAEVQGPRPLRSKLTRGENSHFWDIAVMAVRHGPSEGNAETPAGSGDTPAPSLSGNWQPIRTAPDPKRTAVEVVDLSEKVDDRGRLAWEVPEGLWTVLRFAATTIEGHEYDVDVLDADAVEGHFRRMGKTLIQDAGPLAGKTLTHFYSVSWEGAIPTWTLRFDQDFERYRGYALRPYLPVLAGMTVRSRETSQRLLRDYYKTLGDLFMDNFYGKLRALSNREGLKWHSESGGPWNRKLPTFRQADQLAFLGRTDMPQGEFWVGGRALNRPPAMCAHVYGKPLAATEAFTNMRAHWSSYPALLKPDADAAFCDGINHFIWHTFSASPPEFGQPGIEYFAGTHVNPNVTWFDQAGAFLTYLARCQLMLRRGHFVADVCCYTGDKPYQHWGRGEKWNTDATLTPGKGYTYDLVNDEVLLSRLSVDEDGDLVLPDGMRYRVLAVDLEDETVSPPDLAKIVELADAGTTVVLGKRRPVRAPGLRDYPQCDAEVRRLARELWGDSDEPARRSQGRGTIFSGTPIDDALRAKSILPDFDGPFNYIHRRTDDVDVYFVAGSGHAECTFRVAGREPELWDPTTGRTRDAVWYRTTADGRTVVPLSLPENGSVFVVFRRPPAPTHLVSVSAPAGGLEIEGRSPRGVHVWLWQNGQYTLTMSDNGQIDIEQAGLPEPQTLAGPWTVRFQPGRGAPESAVFEQLVPWNENPIEGIRYFSGTGTYRTTFQLDEQQAAGLVRLRLGKVANVADVRLNGQRLGTVWTAPWSVDLTGIAEAGRNELEIDVTNLWVNRLIGDAGLAPERRITRSNVRLFDAGAKIRSFQGFTAGTPLEPSGLIGPVRVQFGARRTGGLTMSPAAFPRRTWPNRRSSRTGPFHPPGQKRQARAAQGRMGRFQTGGPDWCRDHQGRRRGMRLARSSPAPSPVPDRATDPIKAR